MVVLDLRNTAVKRFIGRTREEDGIEHKELTHMELIDTQEFAGGNEFHFKQGKVGYESKKALC